MILITHTDADGYGCRFVLEEADFKFKTVIHTDYGLEGYLVDLIKTLLKSGLDFKKVMITDLSLKFDTIKSIKDLKLDIHIIDHHLTTERIIDELNSLDVMVDYDSTMSATKLAFELYKHEIKYHNVYDDLIEMINSGDIFKQNDYFKLGLTLSDTVKNEDIMLYDRYDEINSLEKFSFNNYRYNEYYGNFIKKFYRNIIEIDPKLPSTLDDIFNITIDATGPASRFEAIIDRNVDLIKSRLGNGSAKLVSNDNHKIIILDSVAKLSYLSFVFFERNPDIDGLIFVNRESGTLACRSSVNSDLDMSMLVSIITNGNGGGHKNAAGGKFQDIMGYKTYKELCIDRVKDYLENDL